MSIKDFFPKHKTILQTPKKYIASVYSKRKQLFKNVITFHFTILTVCLIKNNSVGEH